MTTTFTQTFDGATFEGETLTTYGMADYWVDHDGIESGMHIFALSDQPGDYVATRSPELYLI
jgi:hypothetical protein